MKNRLLIPSLLVSILVLFSCEDLTEDSAVESKSGYYDYTLLNSGGDFSGIPGSVEGERYNEFEENPFVKVSEAPVSTFSIDADGASYSNVRRILSYDVLPPKGAIRTEELINYFSYGYADPTDQHPVAVNGEVSVCPWNTGNQLIRIGIKGKTIENEDMPPANFVLLVDVSGSMSGEDKLPLLKKGFINFAEKMRDIDRIAIVTYAGSAGVVLNSTLGTQKQEIIQAIESLGSGGSTAGAEGIITAYEIASENKIIDGNNRVILGTDGDFNVGMSSQEELVELIEEKRDLGIFLTVLGYGTGNLNEGMMEQIANNGNGNFEYIDNVYQSDKVFIHEYSKFVTVAKDVKVQVEFHPSMVEEYRLIGYENRLLETEDFEDDTRDAGEIGSGQCITALYEIKPVGNSALRQLPVFTIDFRYKKPDEDISHLITLPVDNHINPFENASEDLRFTASVAGFGMLLWDSEYKGNVNFDKVYQWANKSQSYDPYGAKEEFLELIEKAKSLN